MTQLQLEGYVLSPEQQRVWSARQQAAGECVQGVIEIAGDLDGDRLRTCVQEIVDRHEILRTGFATPRTMSAPLQVVREAGRLDWAESDFSAFSPSRRRAALDSVLDEHAARGFDWQSPPLLHATLARFGDDAHALVLTLSALCADRPTLVHLAALLQRSWAGDELSPGVQYADYSEWLHQTRDGEEAEAGRGWWREQQLPAARPLPFERGAGSVLDLELDGAGKIEAAAERAGVSLAAWLGACSSLWLWRLTGVAPVAIGTVFDGRRYDELAAALGPFSQCLPVVAEPAAGEPFARFLERFAAASAAAEKWQEHYSQPVAESGTPPLVLELEQRRPLPQQSAEVTFSLSRTVSRRPAEIGIVAASYPERLVLELRAPELGAATLERIGGQLATLCRSLAEDPQAPADGVTIVGEDERRRVVSWSDGAELRPAATTLHRLIEEQAARTPQATAVAFGEQQLDFAALNARANQLAHCLQERGVGPEKVVGICIERSLEMVVAILGVLKAGGAYVPLDPGTLNPGREGFPVERLAFMLQDTGVAVLLTQEDLVAALPSCAPEVLTVDPAGERFAAYSTANPESGASPGNLAYVLYTSGSVGRPKAVMIEHRSIVNLLDAVQKDFYADTDGRSLRLSVNAPMGFDPSVQQLMMLARGHALYPLPEEIRTSGRALLDFLVESRLEVLDCTPPQLRLLVAEGLTTAATSSVSRIIVGGEAMDEPTWRAMAEAPHIHVFNQYGPSECTVGATFAPIDDPALPVTIGRPMTSTRVAVLDKGMRRVPIGAIGEIFIGGARVGRGYYRRPGLTAARYVPSPLGGWGERLYRTGDLARYREDGRLDFQGRTDHQVKIRSHRIELGEVEKVLARHPDVREAVVDVRSDLGEPRLVAYVVPTERRAPAIDALRAHLKEWLPEYMLPAAFVSLEALPLTARGKVDRAELPAPDRTRPRLGERFVAPQTQLEQQIAGMWADLLQVDKIGVHDDFFDLGGDSLLSVRLFEKIEDLVGRELPPQIFLGRQTVNRQAKIIGGEGAG